eukprot:GGOE01023879.1.p1 GENE.GGOE01023879.1~~GGOE01023879.1.p1  ORF type:complete len:789 (-),score=150.39 GGOE01023879.1:56-2386(-)
MSAPQATAALLTSQASTMAEDQLLDKVMEEMQRNPTKSIVEVIDGLAEVAAVTDKQGETYCALEPLHQYTGHTCYVVCLAGDGDLLFSAAWDGRINVWALALPDLVLVAQLTDHAMPSASNVRTMRYQAKDRILYTGDQLGVVKAWSLNGLLGFKDHLQRVQRRAEGHAKDVTALECHGEWLLSGGLDGMVRVWALRTLRPVATLSDMQRQQKNAQVWGLSVDLPSHSLFAGGWPEVIYQWSLADFALLRVMSLTDTKGGTRAMASTAGHLYCGHWSGEVTVWNTTTGTLEHREMVDDAVHALCPLGPGAVVVGGRNKQIAVYGMEEHGLKMLVKSTPGTAWINCMVAVGRCIIIGTAANSVEVLGLQTAQALRTVTAGQEATFKKGRYRCATCSGSPAPCDDCEALTVSYYTAHCAETVRESVQKVRTTLQMPRVQLLIEQLIGRLTRRSSAPCLAEEQSAAVLQSARDMLQWCIAQVDSSLADLHRRKSSLPPTSPTTADQEPWPPPPGTTAAPNTVPSRLSDVAWAPRSTDSSSSTDCFPAAHSVSMPSVEELLASALHAKLAHRFVDRLLRTANRFCRAKEDLCPREQLYAFFAYTYEVHDDELDDPVTKDAGSSRRRHDVQIHRILRRVLRDNAPEELALWRPLLHHLEEGLETLPPYSGLLCRRLQPAPPRPYSVGQCIAWEAFLSCSPLDDSDVGGEGVIFVITPCCAKALGPCSWTPDTFEVVCPRDAVFRVTNILSPAIRDLLGCSQEVIELQEVEPLSDFAWTFSG